MDEEELHKHIAAAEDAFVDGGHAALEKYIDVLRSTDNFAAVVIRSIVLARDAVTQSFIDSYLEEDGQD
jgi:hypothetical protein